MMKPTKTHIWRMTGGVYSMKSYFKCQACRGTCRKRSLAAGIEPHRTAVLTVTCVWTFTVCFTAHYRDLHIWKTVYSPSRFISIGSFMTCRGGCESMWDFTVITLFQRHERECHNKLSAPQYLRLWERVRILITQLSSLVASLPANRWHLLRGKCELHGVSRFHLESEVHFQRGTMNI